MKSLNLREISAGAAAILSGTERSALIPALSGFLGSTHVLYQKALFYHWNVTGPHFFALHKAFEDQYRELQEAADVLAERIRALGYFAPGTPTDLRALSAVQEDHALPGNAQEMVDNLLKAHAVCATEAQRTYTLAEKAEDLPTMDILTQRLTVHDKAAWMLRAFLS